MSARKGSIFPIVILGILLLIFTGEIIILRPNFSQPSQNSQKTMTAAPDAYPGWKTYTNTKDNFTIRYPSEWYLREVGDFAADFLSTDPQKSEASPSAVKVRFLRSNEKADLSEFEKIYKLDNNQRILEPLDVRSYLTKNKNLETDGIRGVDFQIERTFSAPEGPPKEFTRVFEFNIDETILKFSTGSPFVEEQYKINELKLEKIISSISFKK